MRHLGRKTCCDYEFTAKDIIPPLMNQRQAISSNERNLYGGNAQRFSKAICPICQREYILWLTPERGSWRVLTISGNDLEEEALPEPEDREAIKAWLENHNIEYAKNAATETLYKKIIEHTQVAQ